MIYQLTKDNDALFDRLKRGSYSRRMRSHYMSYGTKYDFARFFAICRGDEEIGLISIFNASSLVCDLEGFVFSDDELEEICGFLNIQKPYSIELDPLYACRMADMLDELYRTEHRKEFAYVPRGELPDIEVDEMPALDDVYAILRESFPALANSYELWLTDTSHRIRRGLSQSFLIKGRSTATMQYIIDGVALIGQVATLPEYRGQLYARRLLYWIGERLSDDGYEVHLFARPHRVSYYEEIGFAAVAHDIVFELKDEYRIN